MISHRTTALRACPPSTGAADGSTASRVACNDARVTELTFRNATNDDVVALGHLVHAAYRDPDQPGWTTEADILGGQRADATMLAGLIDDDGVRVLVATVAGALVACGTLRHVPGDPVATFGLFAVDPTRQGTGIGGQLLSHAEGVAARLGATRLRLEVIHTRHELLAWYRRRGFEPTGETAPFPYGDERFGLPRRADLHFVLLERALATPASA